MVAYAGHLIGPAAYTSGPTPFISFARLRASDTATLKSAQFTIQPKVGSATRPIDVSYTRQYLQKRGYVDPGTGKVTVPVFGRYAGRSNSVTVTLGFSDGTSQQTDLVIQTATYDGGTYSNPTIVQPGLPTKVNAFMRVNPAKALEWIPATQREKLAAAR